MIIVFSKSKTQKQKQNQCRKEIEGPKIRNKILQLQEIE